MNCAHVFMRVVILSVGALMRMFQRFHLDFPDTIFPQSTVIFSMQFGKCLHGVITEIPVKHLE